MNPPVEYQIRKIFGIKKSFGGIILMRLSAASPAILIKFKSSIVQHKYDYRGYCN